MNPCTPVVGNGRRCETHDHLPIYPSGMCLEGIAQKKIREPNCHCNPTTLWIDRRLDGFWDLEECKLEQRTCLVCGASLSRELPKGI